MMTARPRDACADRTPKLFVEESDSARRGVTARRVEFAGPADLTKGRWPVIAAADPKGSVAVFFCAPTAGQKFKGVGS
jgi:hypothetical protein